MTERKRAGVGPAKDRQAIQTLVRHLVENPDKANEFLKNPARTAWELGIVVSVDEMTLIRSAIIQLEQGIEGVGPYNFGISKRIEASECTHHDFPECHHIEVGFTNPVELVSQPEVKK